MPPASYPGIIQQQGNGVTIGSVGLVAAAAGALIGASVAMASNLGKGSKPEDPPEGKE